MYRDLARSDADWRWLHSHSQRYDITVIPPYDLWGEWAKTKGHYHPVNPAGVGYPEIYEVLAGRAHYLLQTKAADDVVLIGAEAGDLVIIPPDYGHITINPSANHPLVMANIVSTAFESEYADYERMRGAAYYELTTGKFVKNPEYGDVAPLRKVRARSGQPGHRIVEGPLYSLVGNAPALGFLNHPEDCAEIFKVLLKD
jgi:glucose-6-phosphate isomerase